MDKNTANRSIECTVSQCANHCGKENYCALNKIKVGTHEKNPTVKACVDCESFVLDSSCPSGNCAK